MKKILTIFTVLTFTSLSAFAQPKASYYTAATLDGKNSRNLEIALQAIIYPHTKIKYDNLWKAYETTDPGPADSIPSSYTGGKTDLVYDMYAWMSQFPKFYSDNDHSQTGGINREHSVPNSWWGGEDGNAEAYTDLHHLVPADGAANNAKQNYPLGSYQPGVTLAWPTQTKGTYVTQDTHNHTGDICRQNASHVWNNDSKKTLFGGAEKAFEPADEYKGDFARMYLYVVCAYEGKITWKDNCKFMFDNESSGNKYTTIKTWAKDLLLAWHRADPVSKKEKDRNNAVERVQGNRNPFIDYPDLVEYIWGNKSSSTDFSLATATCSYSEKYSSAPSAKWMLGGAQVANIDVEYGQAFTSPTLDVTVPSGTIIASTTYDSSNKAVATVNNSGVVTILSAGTTTISATVTPTDAKIPSTTAAYILTVTKPQNVACYFQETFNTNTGTGGNDDSWDGGIASSTYTSDNAGWTLTKGYGANHCIRVGTSSDGGSAQTPAISFSGDAVITFKAGAWNKDYESTTLKITATNGTLSHDSVTLTRGSWTEYTLSISGVTSSTKITFSSAKGYNRFFLDEIKVTAGYIRSVNTSNIGTICLPRAFEKPSTMTLYDISRKDANKLYYSEASETTTTAGKPYLFRSTVTPIVISYYGEATSVSGSHNGLVGSLNGCSITQNDGNYIISNNSLYVVGSNPYNCSANRAYIHLADVPSTSSGKDDFYFDASFPSVIESLQQSSLNSQIKDMYNPTGLKVNDTYKGIVIVNGKKYVNK